MLDIGCQILHELYPYVHLEQSTNLWCYPSSSIQPLDLMQHVQSDLDAIADLPNHTIIVDQRPPPCAPLTHGFVARAALNTCSPVAFDVPHTTSRGMRAAPDAIVPHYALYTADRTVVAGAGTVLAPRRSNGIMPTVLHVALGQIVLLHFPLTHANARGPPAGSSLQEQFLWALSDPAAVLRVLYPGESTFVPAMHWRCMIALGCHGSSFSATVFLYVRRLEEDTKFWEEAERARKRVRAT